ncbi:chemerin-like receptor 1 [Engraulis encrasicolus]|uniref:chemerin-like receptor 1 n=1 Tax=Engraulis encrasicolus TaxID=184585 RepID=UPI002FCFC7F6
MDTDVDYIMDLDYNLDYNYENYSASTESTETAAEEHSSRHQSTCFSEKLCISLLVINSLIFVLGVLGNGVVIWIAGLKMKKTVNTTWYLSLAVSDFLVCVIHPFNIAFIGMQDWVFGLFLCKTTSFVMFVNMFSSIFLLVFISVDRCVAVVFPVWAQNHRTVKTASLVVVLAWIFSAVLSVPALIFRDVKRHITTTMCLNDYSSLHNSHVAIAYSRFVFGFVVPFALIIVCYSVIGARLMRSSSLLTQGRKVARSRSPLKPLKVMTALIVTFFVCWLPYHVFILLERDPTVDRTVMKHGLQFGTALALANSCLNPVLYVFMGQDFRKKFRNTLLSRIENAIGDGERLSRSSYLSRSTSMDGRASTHI